MRIQVLTATGVRNLAPLTLEPRERFNVFVGDNGQGKTNLLEAIYAVSALRSFRTSRLADMIAFGSPDARIGARVLKDDLVRVYELTIAPQGRRVLLDGKSARPLARYFGGFNVVVFTPEDLALPRGAPGDRRRFLDRAVFNARPEYLAAVQDYEKILKQRNAILKHAAQGTMAPARVEDMLTIYDAQLAAHGLAIANARAKLVEEVRVELARAFQAITQGERVASARYVSKTAGATVEEVIAHHKAGRAKDLATQSTQFGPHRDDLAFEIGDPQTSALQDVAGGSPTLRDAGGSPTLRDAGGSPTLRDAGGSSALHGAGGSPTQRGAGGSPTLRDAGGFASQGQLRAIMLAWKTAELAVLARTHGDQPILLLDDVSSELDPARNRYLFEHLALQAGQVFITTTHEGHVLLTRDRADYRIQNGQISS